MKTPLTVDVKGAADLLKVHPKTVLEFIHSGALPAAKVGRAYVMMTKDIMEYLENQVVHQTTQRMRKL